MHMGAVLASNLKQPSSFASMACPLRVLGTPMPSVMAYAIAPVIAQLMWHGMSSSASIFAYAGVSALVARSVARWEPADIEIVPIFSGSKPFSLAAALTMRTARWPSSHALWWIGSPFGRGVR